MAVNPSIYGMRAGGEQPQALKSLEDLHLDYDTDVANQRAGEDEQTQAAIRDGSNPMAAQAQIANTFNRGQQDAAMGPGGWNRQWAGVPLGAGMGTARLARMSELPVQPDTQGGPFGKFGAGTGGNVPTPFEPFQTPEPLSQPKKALKGLQAATPQPYSLG